MKALVREGMGLGRVGLSTGVMYLPGRFATTAELVELAREVAPYDGIYDSHVRDPVKNFLESVLECIEIGERSGARPHPAHHKAVGKLTNWGKAQIAAGHISRAIDRGIDVTVDQYPYDGAAVSRLIRVLVLPEEIQRQNLMAALGDPETRKQIQVLTDNPPAEVYSWVQTVGYESFRIVHSNKFPDYVGKMVIDIAREKGVDPFSLICEIVLEEGPDTVITLGACKEEEVQYILTRPWTMIASDGGYKMGHPRSYGTFPRVLGRYVRELEILSLEEAIYKMTGLTSDYFRFEQIGKLQKGYMADITIFDPASVSDRATWSRPWNRPCPGKR
jgi:N-acyl-D-aspartate/D-glutamate deacylase